MNLKIGDLVQVCKGKDKGLIGHVHEIDIHKVNDEISIENISVVRLQKDIDAGLFPITDKYKIGQLMKRYTDEELRYSATSRCDCGAGLAYPKGKPFIEINCWDCSDILTGRALLKDPECKNIHAGQLPFAFYEIKSEDQPSAMGKTTRTKKI